MGLIKHILNERISSVLQLIEKTLGQNGQKKVSLSNPHSLFSMPQSLSSNSLAQIKPDLSYVVEEQIIEIEKVLAVWKNKIHLSKTSSSLPQASAELFVVKARIFLKEIEPTISNDVGETNFATVK